MNKKAHETYLNCKEQGLLYSIFECYGEVIVHDLTEANAKKKLKEDLILSLLILLLGYLGGTLGTLLQLKGWGII